MTIYVDTNAIPPHGPLDSIDLSALRAVVMEHGFDVALPRMVVEESIGQRRRHVRAAIERVRSAQHAVREFWKVESPPSPDLDDTVEQWRTHLEGRFRIVETPANAANEALAREIHRIPPTRDGKGARDAVIWLSIIDDIKGTDGESNFLITSNKKDFASPQDPNSFHPALLEELGARALTARGESRSYEGSTQSIRRTTLTRMAMGTRETDQPPLWIATSDLPTSPGHPFYARLTTLLDGHHFDRFVEGLCDRFYAPVMGRPSLAPGRYFRLLLVGYFEGIDSERGMAWRATDSLAVRSFLRLAVDEAPPDHSTIARTRRLIDLETHRTVFTWVQQRLVEAGRLTGKTIAIDATTLEANAAMRSIVRRDTGESYQAFLAGLATASGVETPTREGLARLDRKRKKKTSNTDWTNPHDPDAKVTKMKDGRTHLAHKAEHAVDMETGAIVAVTLQGADVGDTTTIIETAIAATEQVEDAQANVDDRQSLEEIVGDKGYHSNQTLIDLDAVGIRSYVSEPDRGRRDWSKDPEARAPVYGNRRRMRGRRGRRLMRQRGERIERSFAHLYDTGGMRRTHLRGHTNILKRLLIHAGGFNLGLVMRHLIGIGTPRGLQGRVAAVLATLGVLMGVVRRRLTTISSSHRLIPAVRGRLASLATFAVNSSAAITCTTGC